MSPFADLWAQEPAAAMLARALSTNRVASSYLFEGPDGVGKQKAALALAAASVSAGRPEDVARVRAGTHPDVRIFVPRDEGNRNIQIDYLRQEILPYAQFAPFEAEAAFLIFPEADVSFPALHPEGANALLKTLEEPRPRVHFVLLSARPDRLLPTILSRCQRVRFRRLPPEVLERVLAEQGVAPEARPAAVALADGRADRALRLAEGGIGESVLALALEIDEAVAGTGPGTLVDAAEKLARAEDLPLALDTLVTFYRDVAAAGLGLADAQLSFRHAADRVRARARRVPPREASARVALVRGAVDAMERNANPQITLDALVFAMRGAR